MNRTARRIGVAALGGLSVTAALAGCSSSSAASTSTDPVDGSGSSSSASYTDGTYEATGDYQSPGGQESIDVTITLEGNIVTDVVVVGNATSGNALRYQTEFEDGIGAEVIGKNIDELDVDKVAGSSLTSDGFDAALEKIKADAVA